MISITYIVADIDRALAFEWIVENLNPKKFKVDFILLNNSPSFLEEYLWKNNIRVKVMPFRNRTDYFFTFLKLFFQFLIHKPDVVHSHFPIPSLIAITVAWLARIPHRVLTRHCADYHHRYKQHFLKYNKTINKLATCVVATSKNVEEILVYLEDVPKQKISLVHHGFDLKAFEGVESNRIQSLRLKYLLTEKKPAIGVIARYFKWKGIQYIIPAFLKLLDEYPDAVLILGNAAGTDYDWIHSQVLRIPNKNVCEIRFEKDLFALYQLFDVYVHTPIDGVCEAFGQTYVEALAAGIPSVFTLSGIAHEFIKHGENALVVDYKNPNAIYEALKNILEKKVNVEALIANGKASVQQFQLMNMISNLEKIYEA